MPGRTFTMTLEEALAVAFRRQVALVEAQDDEPLWPAFVTAQERVAFLGEAHRVIKEAAEDALARCCPPPEKERSKLRLIKKEALHG
jgi:hypothetical protein